MAESRYRYSVFMSYAHDDDLAWSRWISLFNDELNRTLPARLRELDPPGTFLSSKNGAIQGGLNQALKEAIQSSFAMIVFVHDGYLRSSWCLKELQLFRELHGQDGFRGRMFIVAMSKRAIDKLSTRDEWLSLFPSPDPVWMEFHQKPTHLPNQPIGMFLTDQQGTAAVASTEFLQPFFRLRERLVEVIQDAADLDPDLFKEQIDSRVRRPVTFAQPDGGQALEVRVYIEGEPGQEGFWEPLGLQVTQAWDPVARADTEQPPLRLRPTGLPLHDLRNRPRLDDADGVILLWGEKTPESLLAQIQMVEPKLTLPKLAPGLIAYLTDADAAPSEQVPSSIRGWPVVRFASRQADPASAVVDARDAPKLEQFLGDVLRRKRQH
jgi:hypothetical protein